MRILSLIFFAAVISWLTNCSKTSEKSAAENSSVSDTIAQKDGSVLQYTKPAYSLISLKRDKTVYAEEYSNRLRKIAELYLDKNSRELVNYHKNRSESQMGYSVEENDWEGVDYTQIGIFNKSGQNISTLQWLFYEPNSQKLYEFDLNRKKLTEFKLK